MSNPTKDSLDLDKDDVSFVRDQSKTSPQSNNLESKEETVQKDYATIEINRPPYTRSLFNLYGEYNKEKKPIKNRIKNSVKECCDFSSFFQKIFSFFPFISILSKYKLTDFLSDLVAGLTVGIMHIPQGMAYGMLANIDPVYGLYSSFFPVIVYFFLGTSKHISIGTFAVVSLMIGAVVNKAECDSDSEVALNKTIISANFVNGSWENVTDDFDYAGRCKLEVVVSLTFLAGLIQLVLAIFKFGMVTIYLSSPLTRALTTGAAVHIFTSQIKHVFGVRTGRFEGFFTLVWTYKRFFERIGNTNWAAVVMSVICIIILYCLQRWANPVFKKYIKMPLPSEFLLLIIGTVISASFHFSSPTVYGMRVVGDIPQGFPAPSMPKFTLMPKLITDSVFIALVSFIISISMSKLFADMEKYEINSNQELAAYGITNMVCSFFNSYVSTASLSRSFVQYTSGGKTQVAGLVSCLLLLVVILAVGPYFKESPNCVLAAIIIVNLKGVFLQVLDLVYLVKISKYDAIVWVITCLAVVFSDVSVGLMIGVAFGLFSIVLRTQSPKTRTLGVVQGTECYQDISEFKNAKEINRIKIIGFDTSLYYANASYFSEKLKLSNLWPHNDEKPVYQVDSNCCRKLKSTKFDVAKSVFARQFPTEPSVNQFALAWDLSCKHYRLVPGMHHYPRLGLPSTQTVSKHIQISPENNSDKSDKNDKSSEDEPCFTDLIIDFGLISFIDADGIVALNEVAVSWKRVNVAVSLARCCDPVYSILKKSMEIKKLDQVEIYLTVHDAVSAIRREHESKNNSPTML